MPSSTSSDLRALWKMAALGFQFAAEVGAAVLLGWLADRWLGSLPRWTIVGAIAGVVLATFSFIRTALRLNRQMERDERS